MKHTSWLTFAALTFALTLGACTPPKDDSVAEGGATGAAEEPAGATVEAVAAYPDSTEAAQLPVETPTPSAPVIGCAAFTEDKTNLQIAMADVNKALEDGCLKGQIQFIDARSQLDYESGHIAGAIDVPFQLWEYHRRLRMTKEEVRQEMKEQEGDPQIKARIRAAQREMSRRRMMTQVPTADVVVTNPTHYAVALKYDPDKAGAPIVVAKGMNLIALNIRELARENSVPILEAPPLARALYANCELEQPIPTALYTVVAEVMAWVFQLNHWMAEGGLPPEQPTGLAVPEGMDPAAGEATT